MPTTTCNVHCQASEPTSHKNCNWGALALACMQLDVICTIFDGSVLPAMRMMVIQMVPPNTRTHTHGVAV